MSNETTNLQDSLTNDQILELIPDLQEFIRDNISDDLLDSLTEENIDYDLAVNYLAASEQDYWEDLGNPPSSGLLAKHIGNPGEFAQQITIEDPDKAAAMLTELLYWQKMGRL